MTQAKDLLEKLNSGDASTVIAQMTKNTTTSANQTTQP
jgi:hypothetical protein